MKNQANLACGSDCDSAADVVDFVGYGAANDFAGSGPAPGLSNTTSDQRNASAFQHRQQRHRLHHRSTHAEGPTRDGDAAARLRRDAERPRLPAGLHDDPGHPGLRVPLPGRRREPSSACPGSSRRSGRPAAARVSGSSRRTPTSAVPRPRPGSSSSPARPPSRCPPSVTPSSSPGRVSDFYPRPGETRDHVGQPLHHRDHPHARDRAQLGQRRSSGAGHHPDHGSGHLRPAAAGGRDQRRVDHHGRPEPLDPGVLGGARGHARHGQQRPCGRARASRSSARST